MTDNEFTGFKTPDGDVSVINAVWAGVESPDDWEPMTIGENVDIQGGNAFSSDDFSTDADGTPLIKRKTVNNDQYPEEFVQVDFDSRYNVEKGDLLVSMDRYFRSMIWEYEDAALNQRVCKITPGERIDAQFLSYAIERPLWYLEHLGGTTDFTSLSMKDFDNIDLPIPPMEEQKQIVSILSNVDMKIDALSERRDWLDRQKRGVRQNLLTGDESISPDLPVVEDILNRDQPADIETGEEWQEQNIEDAYIFRDNERVPLNKKEREERTIGDEGDIPYYGANGVVDYIDDYLFDEELILVAEDGGHFEEYSTRPISYHIQGKAWVNNHAHVLEARDHINNWYGFYALEHKNLVPYITGSTRAKLNKGNFKLASIPVPPLWEQERIASSLYTLDEMIQTTEELISEHKRLKKGLMQDLLTGDVRPRKNLEVTHEVEV